MLSQEVREESRLGKDFLAGLAYEHFFLLMHFEMLIYIALLRVGVHAALNWTHEWFLFHMCPQMVEEVTPLLELFITVGVLAQEYLGPLL